MLVLVAVATKRVDNVPVTNSDVAVIVPLAVKSATPVMLLLSSMITPEFCISLPVVKLNLATALSVALEGPTTSPVTVEVIVTVLASVRETVIPVPLANLTSSVVASLPVNLRLAPPDTVSALIV